MIDFSAFNGKPQAYVKPIHKPRVLEPEYKTVEFLTVDKSTECHITPNDIADLMVDYLNLEPCHTILEPSFGTGRLIDSILSAGHDSGLITAIEKNQTLFNLYKKDIDLINMDFLEYEDRLFDRIIMNPPFSKGQALKHFRKAQSLLMPGGEIIALMPVTFKHGYTIQTLEAGIFESTDAVTKLISCGEEA